MRKVCYIIMLMAAVCCAPVFGKKLTKADAETVAAELWQQRRAEMTAEYGSMWDSMTIRHNGLRMPFGYKIYGEKPADGRSLYISMHGGGNAPADLNTQQWRNQLFLYAPAEGVYVAPRAAVDDWNMWFRPHIDTLFTKLIRAAVLKADVNPDKVYLMGYSAGGDGVYRLAPRLADHWAAAAMMAGHPGESSPLNLRNIGFTLWMGGNDGAYDRNNLARYYAEKLDSLQAADPEGYVHDVHIQKGYGHWMERADTLAVEWMSHFRRTPYPDRVVWRQEESNLREAFYYLSVPLDEAEGGMEVRVDKDGNVFDIVRNDYSALRIWLNDEMIDFSLPVEVRIDGRRVFRGKLERHERLIRHTVTHRSDPRYIFSAALEIRGDKVRRIEKP